METTQTVQLTPEVVEAYQTLLTKPTENGLPFRAIEDCFEQSNTVTAKHILAAHYMEEIDATLPKVIVYIIMDNVFGQCTGKDAGGNAGYHLKYKPV